MTRGPIPFGYEADGARYFVEWVDAAGTHESELFDSHDDAQDFANTITDNDCDADAAVIQHADSFDPPDRPEDVYA